SRMHEDYRSVFRVHVFPGRGEQEVHSPLRGEPRVIVEGTWVPIEIFTGPELERIDEDAHDDRVGHALCCVDKFEVTFVQGAHGRHEGNAPPLRPKVCNDVTHFVDRSHYLHLRNCA